MPNYKEYKQLDLPQLAAQVLDRWEQESIFEKSITSRNGRPSFTFYEGPPSANGLPGIHHVMARSIKDIFCRYKTQKGFQVKRKGGWDTHGLPIEISVEKSLGITKEDIGNKNSKKYLSVEDYNSACRKEVMKYKNVWDDLTRKMGYWVDLEHPYITFDNNYIETCWYLLKQFYSNNLLYKGYTIQPYSPAAGTGLSSHELNQPGTYKMIKDTSAVAQFEIKRNGRSEFLYINTGDVPLYFLAWTTTPWTLPANCALAVGEKITYVLVQTFNPYTFQPAIVILAKDLINKYFPEKNNMLPLEEYIAGDKNIPFKILAEYKGSELKGVQYQQLLPYVQPVGKAFEVITGDFVTTEDGTGVVHTASVFGADDFRVCKLNDIASVMVTDESGNLTPLVDKRGRFVKEVTDFAGEYVKEEYLTEEEKATEIKKQGRDKYLSVDERIAIKLKQENKAFKVERYEHSYPHCWRTDKPILYYPLDSWFIKTTAKKQQMMDLNKTINWKPESTGTGRFGNWLENLVDWNLSRSRYWGIPLPIWRTEDGTEEKCIGSIEELKMEIEKSITAGFMDASHLEHVDAAQADLDLHRPYVDNIYLVSDTGRKMFRETDLIDVWFDSGAMPYAQWGLNYDKLKAGDKFPFNDGWNGAYPADFIAEGVDQTRGWFFTLHAIAVMLFDSVAFKNVVSNGLVLDKNGNKMSKRLGNAADPFETLNKYGPDATRWYMISNAQPWDNLKFNLDGIAEVQRKFFGTLYNTYSFFAMYANIDGFIYKEAELPVNERPEIDRWIISVLNSLVKEVDACYADYEPTKATRMITDFVCEHLSNWYVRLCRRRFWKQSDGSEVSSKDKLAAYQTLYHCLNTVAGLMAPVAPFFADRLFSDLNEATGKNINTSVHLSDFPLYEATLVDAALEERMQLAQTISSLVLSLRKKVNIKVRQPLNKILLPVIDTHFKEQVELVKSLILAEVNVEAIEYITDTSGLLTKKIRPNFKTLGKKAGAMMKDLGAAITAMDQQMIAELEKNGAVELTIPGNTFTIVTEDVEILSEDIPGWQVATEGKVTVALDTHITEELKEKGMARELVNRIQNMRKDKGYAVTDRITVRLKGPESIVRSVTNNLDYIRTEILATSLEFNDALSESEGENVEIDENLHVLTLINKN